MGIRALEFYSGIGGLHRALAQSNVQGSVVRAFDWDQSAYRVYTANYGQRVVHKVDICSLTAAELAQLDADLWLLSPSCQPYTVLNPLAKGAEDPRAKSFICLMEEVLPELVQSERHPRYMLVENVAGFESSSTRLRVLDTLRALRYTTVELLITPLQFGIPNSRLRYYLLAKATPLAFAGVDDGQDDRIWRHIPGHGTDWIDPRTQTQGQPGEERVEGEVAELRDFLDEDTGVDRHPHAIPERVLEKWGRLFDIVLPSARRTCCFTRGYTNLVERAGSVLQVNEGLDTTRTFDAFLDAQRAGDDEAVRLLRPLRLRYFSPTELLRLFAFLPPATNASLGAFTWPEDISTKTKYKLIGNSVNVRVVTELINYLFE
ncbi:S-adenosyl-L-methionine-dependent methyltransferase [Lentinus tigrinus ALCF2SS1-7]|uniref:tRNA (cytosine(38)-C(5))-methyltransferase n=1 Tax=Lentinus tigrinus ALCF2SS1-6 TaxID=1328759 RepID=A0A5C2S8H1_9APHY|nr:S-adenosyl-L-methionine-dependent methyltransferase [Lentinus tigrinus ALCF2SS1-6]RPD68776.1 S-adenosyl-L-methionine-dependent methyltransferase [Lentinus tigrinus ALCF2SS1-7]